MADFTEFLVSPAAAPAARGSREDFWTEEATATLVDAWGRRYLELSRGSLRRKDWKEVADAVNRRHGGRRTEVQCKNRIDTLKKKYKVEKAKVEKGTLMSSWPFFSRLELLIGSKAAAAAAPLGGFRKPRTPAMVTPVVLPQKRPLGEEAYFRRNYSAIAAAAENDSYGGEEEEEEEGEGVRRLAMAIERFGEMYERVEGVKQRQMVELEKQRMQFAKDLEVQRMRLFMDTQLQLEKVKQGKGSRLRSRSSRGIYS